MSETTDRAPAVTQDPRPSSVRTRILDAAVQCLTDAGYAHTSTLMIQHRAGVSRGGLLHHFPSKNALLVASVQHLAAVRISRAAATIPHFTADDGTPERIDEAVVAMWERYQEPYFKAAAQLWVAGLHDAELQATLGPVERQLNVAIREATEASFGPTHVAHPEFGVVRDILLTSMRGLALAEAFEGHAQRHRRFVGHWQHVSRTLLVRSP